jgi:hypothetical protein
MTLWLTVSWSSLMSAVARNGIGFRSAMSYEILPAFDVLLSQSLQRYSLFDLLWLNGADFGSRPLLDRKAAVLRVLPANRRVRYAKHINDSSVEVWQLAVQMELEALL